MKKAVFILLSLVTLTHFQSAHAHSPVFLNPGGKVGFTFGDKTPSEVVWGLELSVSVWPDNHAIITGATAGVDFVSGKVKKVHVGAEASYYFFGIDLGPTLVFEGPDKYLGYSLISFLGAIIYPYFNYTRWKEESMIEAGSYLKIPVSLNGVDPFRL